MKQLLVFICLAIIISSCHRSLPCDKEIYLVPEGFKGKIIIFFDQDDGQEKQYENEARLYKIPSSGILKSQFPRNGGCMDDGRIQFYYEDSLGKQSSMDYFLNIDHDSLPTDRDYVLFTFLSDKGKKPDFVIHFVGHLSEFNDLTQSVRYFNPVAILDSI